MGMNMSSRTYPVSPEEEGGELLDHLAVHLDLFVLVYMNICMYVCLRSGSGHFGHMFTTHTQQHRYYNNTPHTIYALAARGRHAQRLEGAGLREETLVQHRRFRPSSCPSCSLCR